MSSAPALEARGVSFRWPGAPSGLRSVSLALRSGELLALLGPNGAGKSSLLRVLAGLERASEGEVLLEGASLAGLPRRDVARRVGWVPQSEASPAAMTVREVVSLGRAPWQGPWGAASPEDPEAVRDALARCALTELAERPVEALSGGEKRRVSLARALAQRARVLLCDEPVAGLDPRHQLAVCATLQEEAARGVAVVAVLHDPNLALRFFTRAALLREGELRAEGPSREALSAEALGELFGVRLWRGEDAEGVPVVQPVAAR